MLAIFSYAFNAVSPILILVVIGYLLRENKVFEPDFFKKLNRFAFHYCFPPLMFTNLYKLGSIRDIDLRLAGYLMVSILTITAVSILLSNLVTKVRNRKGVLIQAGFRSNFAVIGLPLVEGLCGAEGASIAAAMQAPTVIYFNLAAVLFLTMYSDDAEFDFGKVMKNVASNPMIQGLGLGLAALVIREFIPVSADGTLIFSISGTTPWLYTVLNYLGRLGTPLCLIAMGGQFSFGDIGTVQKELTWGVCMRLLLAPAIGFGMAFAARSLGLLAMTPTAVGIMVAAYGSPIATSSAVMAAEMKGDDVLAGQIVVWNCFFSIFTVFILTVGFRYAGLL